jgi:Immunoglobulin-like domain of bacterial spore germination
MIKAIYILVAIAILAGLAQLFFVSEPTEVACTMDAMMCPDGSYVGRTGSKCEFVCPALSEVPADLQAHINEKAELIKLTTPVPNGVVGSPLLVSGQARGGWFFEASFPVSLTNWDGLIIAEGVAQASTDWMTTEFVPFTATLTFTNPYQTGDQDFMKKGALILQKDNPSGLPENADALEIPIRFAP